MKAILLVRISTDKQEYEEQKNDLIAYSIDKNYKEHDLIIVDHEESAIKLTIEERQGIIKIKKSIAEDKLINSVFVWELSRLVRNQTEGHLLKDYFFKNKIQFYCLKPEIQLFDETITAPHETGDITFSLFLQVTESEMRTKKARFHRAKIRNAKTGKFSGGFVKYGYYVDDKGYYQIKDDEAKLIRYVFDRYLRGISIIKLNKELNERGLHDSTSFVTETLKCEAYTGLSNRYGMNRKYPQIVSNEQFEAVKERKRTNNKKLDKANEIYFAKGLIKCTHCGAKYMAMKTSIQYLCYNRFGRESRINPKLKCKQSLSININILDTILFEACIKQESLRRFKNQENVLREINNEKEICLEKLATCQNKMTQIDLKNERNNDIYMMGKISKEKYLSNDKRIEVEKRSITNNIVDLKNKISRIHEETTRIESLSKKADTFTLKRTYKRLVNDIYSIDDLIEKQKIVKRHVWFVEIEDDIPNHTKIVNIMFNYDRPFPLKYRVHYKKMPQMIEVDDRYYDLPVPATYNVPDPIWLEVDFKIEKRFVRKKKSN